MDKIIFRISKNLLSVMSYNKDTPKEALNNTTIIDTKELVFSKDYIKKNLELVSSFLNVIILKKEVNRVNVKNFDDIAIILDIISYIPSITYLYLRPEKPINYEMFLKLLDNKYLKNVNAYDIPPYLLERLDINKDLNIHIRSEILFLSNFMNTNDLNTFSDIYYKKYIIINSLFDEDDYNDFNTFININKYLKVIEFTSLNNDVFNYIMDNIFKHNLENIRIVFNEETISINELFKTVNDYKKHHERKLKNSNIIFKINYSDKYKKNNMFKQINLNFIKVSLLAIIIVVATMMSINIYRNYRDAKSYDNIEQDLNDIMKDLKRPVNYNDDDIEYIEPNGTETKKTTTTSVYDIKYDKVFDKLLEINKDTVGWLTVNGTKIDYPVTQSSDNDYYLYRDYYQNKNRHGWIFMDYRNDAKDLDNNTIIYGHNLANQSMFGTLRYSLNSYWYKKTSNQIITFNTPTENMNWQIISIYTIPVTTDYLVTKFNNNLDYLNFLNMIVGRSIYDFGQSYDENDKILTLSTCTEGSEKRLVVHAKLIKEN